MRKHVERRELAISLEELAQARFHRQRSARDVDRMQDGALAALRTRFEAAEGQIQREYWGQQLPLGLVLTEFPRGLIRRVLGRPPRMQLRRTRTHLEHMPVAFHAALHHGDALAVRASWSLGDLSRHTVLDRIFDNEAFLLGLADDAQGRVRGRPAPGSDR